MYGSTPLQFGMSSSAINVVLISVFYSRHILSSLSLSLVLDALEVPSAKARRSYSFGNVEASIRDRKVEKPIEFEGTKTQSPPRKVLKVPQNLRDRINGRSPPNEPSIQ